MSQPSEPSAFATERLVAAAREIVTALEGTVLGQTDAVETLVVAY